jgi:PAS domain S-box-containing protein
MAFIKIDSTGVITNADSEILKLLGTKLNDIIDVSYSDFQRLYLKGLNYDGKQASKYYISANGQLSLIYCEQPELDELSNATVQFNSLYDKYQNKEAKSIFIRMLQKICLFQNSKIAFVDLNGETLWINKALEDYSRKRISFKPNQILTTIQNEQASSFHLDIYKSWVEGSSHSAIYRVNSNTYQLFFEPLEFKKNALAGFKIEIKEIAEEKQIATNENLNSFPLKNPFPVFKINTDAQLIFANGPATQIFCRKEGKLKSDFEAQFLSIINSFAKNDESKVTRIYSNEAIYTAAFQRDGNNFNVYCFEISELVDVEKKNKDNVSLLSAIVNSSSNSIILLNKQKKITYFNVKAKNKYKEYLGSQLIIGNEFPHFNDIEFKKTINRSIDTVFTTKRKVTFDIALKSSTISSLWYKFIIYPVKDNEETVDLICLNIENITHAKNIENQIKNTKEFYEAILNNIPADIAVFDKNQNYLFINPIALKDEKMRKWLIGKNDYDYFKLKGVDSSIADKRREKFLQTIKNKGTNDLIDHQIKPDGKPHYTLRRFYPHFYKDELKFVIGYGLDVTEMQLAQEYSKISENKFKSLFENNPMILFILDQNFKVISANNAAVNHFNINVNDLQDFNFISLIEPNFCEEFKLKFNQAFKMQLQQSHTCICELNYNNREFKIEFSATPIVLSSGETHLLLAGSDYTEKIKNQERLRLSEEFNRKLIDNMPIPFAIVESEKMVFMNQACCDLLEIANKEESVGRSLREFINEIDFPIIKKNLQNRFDKKSLNSIDIEISTQNNSTRFVEVKCGLMELNNNQITFISFNDKTLAITESKARISAELKTKQIIETALDAVITINSKAEIQIWNPKAEQIFGWKHSEVKGKNISDIIIPPGMRQMHKHGMERHLVTGESRVLNTPLELSAVNKFGKEFPVELYITRMEVEGEVLFSSFIRDITERKAAQEALQSSERKLSILVSTLPVVPYTTLLDANYSFTYLSDRIKAFFGYSANEILNEEGFWVSHILEDDLDLLNQSHKELLEIGETNIQYRIKNAFGKIIWIRDSRRIILNANEGDANVITGVFQDVTQAMEDDERRKLTDNTLLEISRLDVTSKSNLNDFYDAVFEVLNRNLNISGLSIWEINKHTEKGTCISAFYKDEEEIYQNLGIQVETKELIGCLSSSKIIHTNNTDSASSEIDLINKVFRKTADNSLVICLLNGLSDNSQFLALESNQPFFKWEYEHLKLVNSISELISANIEYFRRLDSESKLQEVYKIAKIGAWEIDKEANITFWSESMYDFYNLNPKEDKPLDISKKLEFIHPDERSGYISLYLDLIKNLKPFNTVTRHVYPNGEIRYFEKSAGVNRNALNNIIFMGVTVDITDKKLAEIEQEKLRMNQFLKNSLGAKISNVENQDELMQIFLELLIEANFVKNCCLIGKLNNSEQDPAFVIIKVIPNNKISATLEEGVQLIIKQHSDGDLSFLKVITRNQLLGRIDISGKGNYFILFNFSEDDNTIDNKTEVLSSLLTMVKEKSDRIFSEEQVKQLNVELLDSNIQLRQYSFIVSHNLRAPVANILGCLDIFDADNIGNVANVKLLEGLKTSAKSVDRILKDLNEILNIKENIANQFEYVYFDKVLHLVIDSIREDMKDVDFELNSNFSRAEGFDSFKPYLVSIFQNILSNSFKYREPSRKLIISIISKFENNKLLLEFKDNGRGIDLEKNGDKLFKLYSRFHSDVKGTGIGLNMVKEQARVMGGVINVESKVNEGVFFTLIFTKK